jgi:hypothetical protein
VPRREPYWLTGGTEACERCAGRYVLEMEVRCFACDAGLCVHCALFVSGVRRVLCAPCAGEG